MSYQYIAEVAYHQLRQDQTDDSFDQEKTVIRASVRMTFETKNVKPDKSTRIVSTGAATQKISENQTKQGQQQIEEERRFRLTLVPKIPIIPSMLRLQISQSPSPLE